MSDLRLTGERTLPGIPRENYWYRRHVAAYRFARRFAGGIVVDAGCGEGFGSAMLARRADVVALDRDPTIVRHARGRYPGPRFAVADLCRLPVSGVEAIIALQVVEHLRCADRFLAACGGALVRRGTLLLSTPNRVTFPAGLNPSHTHEYDAHELRDLLAGHFEEVEVLGLGHRLSLRLLERLLGEGLQRRLVRVAYRDLPRWLRAVLRSVTSRDFRVSNETSEALDLLAIARSPRRSRRR